MMVQLDAGLAVCCGGAIGLKSVCVPALNVKLGDNMNANPEAGTVGGGGGG